VAFEDLFSNHAFWLREEICEDVVYFTHVH
jgi:hypothetical protein